LSDLQQKDLANQRRPGFLLAHHAAFSPFTLQQSKPHQQFESEFPISPNDIMSNLLQFPSKI